MLAILLAGAMSGSPMLPPPWQPAELTSADEYARYTRAESDGTQSIVVASQRACECQPADAVRMLTDALNKVEGVKVQVDTTTMCGQSAQHLIATGIARPDMPERRNVDTFLFRQGKSMYIFTYTFTYAAPMPDVEQALTAFCQSGS
ncbi:MAG TPA: hypothetical protein VFF60_09390 [Candidatus Binatus sp.]|nr:hypothetical protein [Candidatus Binatus sp.]